MDCFREPPLWRNKEELKGKPALRDASYMQQLQNEMMEWYREILPTEQERAGRAAAVKRVEEEAQALWPGCRLSPFGSYATGLYLPCSDVDACIVLRGKEPQLSDLSIFSMRLMSRSGAYRNVDFRRHATVPIVAFDEAASGIHFDVHMVHHSKMSSRSTREVQAMDFTNTSVAEFPSSLAPLYMVLKAFLQHKGLNEVYRTGGINSFMLLAMVKAFLLLHRDEQMLWHSGTSTGGAAAAGTDNGQLAFLLLGFFHFYGVSLDVGRYGVTCRDNGRGCRRVLPVSELAADRSIVRSRRYGELFVGVEDPLGPHGGRDIGKSSFNFGNIRAAFRQAYETLSSSCTTFVLSNRVVAPASAFRRR